MHLYFWCICGGGRWFPHLTLPPSPTRLKKLTFDVRNLTYFAVWLGVFFPQIVGPKIVASGDSTALPLLLSNSTDLQLKIPTKNAKVKKKQSFRGRECPRVQDLLVGQFMLQAGLLLPLARFTNGTQCPGVFLLYFQVNRAQFAGVLTKYHLEHYLGVGRRELGFYSWFWSIIVSVGREPVAYK